MGLEVTLEVEDLELILLRESEELAEGSVGLDDLLLHETLLLGIGANSSSDFRAAHESTLGLAEEHAEIIRDLRRLGEDRLLLGLVGTVGSLAVATTLGGLLELARNAALKLLHVREDGGEGSTESIHLLNHVVELGNNVDFLNRGSSLNSGGRGGYNNGGGNNGSGNRGSRGGSLGLLGGGSGGFLGGSLGAHFISGREVVYTATKRSFFRLQISSSPGEKSQEINHRGWTFL